MTHICICKLGHFGSNDGLSHVRSQAIIRTNVAIFIMWALGTSFCKIWIEIQYFSTKKMRLKMSSAKWWPFGLGFNVLIMATGHTPFWEIVDVHVCRSIPHPHCAVSLQLRHDGRDSVWNHQPYDCSLIRLFIRRSKKTSKLRVIGLCEGNSRGAVNSPHK